MEPENNYQKVSVSSNPNLLEGCHISYNSFVFHKIGKWCEGLSPLAAQINVLNLLKKYQYFGTRALLVKLKGFSSISLNHKKVRVQNLEKTITYKENN